MHELVPERVRKLSPRVKGSNPHAAPVIATREYKVGKKRVLRVSLHAPVAVRKTPPMWVAAFTVEGLAEPCTGSAAGVDSLHALLLAAQEVRKCLEALPIAFSWFGGDPGDTGIPRTIASYYGLAFSRHLEQVIADETTKFVQRRRRSTRKKPVTTKSR